MEMQGNLIIEFINLNELSKLDINYLIIAYRGFSGNTGSPQKMVYMRMQILQKFG